jgi:tetratricopeptide (TPR) repeat protein
VNRSIPAQASPKWHDSRTICIIHISIILLTGIAAYANSLNGPFHFDDLGISDKSYLWPRAFTSGPRQLVDLTFVLNHLLHGENVLGYHLVNVTIHLLAAVTLYCLVKSVLTALSISFHTPDGRHSNELQFIRNFIPCATALLFVCHPVQTQAVSYIVQRYASMVALFYLCSVLAFIRARLASLLGRPAWRTIMLSMLSLLSGAIALRCKETSYTLPLMLIVVEIYLFRGDLLRNKAFIGCMVSLLLLIPAVRIVQHGLGGLADLLYSIQHSTKEELTYSRTDYLLTQFRVVTSYLRLLIIPINLNLDYDIPLQKSLFTLPVLSSLMLHLTLLGSSAALYIHSGRRMLEKSGHQGICLRLISFGIIWFYLTLSVESSIIPILDVMFEHRLYLPSCGGFMVIAAASAALLSSRSFLNTAAWIVLATACSALTYATIQRNRIWNDDLLLWEDTARKSPNKARVLSNLTVAYLKANRPEKAIPLLIRTIELSPGFTDALNNLGHVLDMLKGFEGRYDNGRRYITGTRTTDLRYYNSWFANTRNNLGLLYEHSGNQARARYYYETAVSLSPSFDLAWYNLLVSASRQQDRQLAEKAYERLTILNPGLARDAVVKGFAPH